MTTRKTILITSLFVIFLMASATLSFAEYGWNFDTPDEYNGWHTLKNARAGVTDGSLVVEWDKTSQLVSPRGLGIFQVKYMSMKARSSKASLAKLRVLSGTTGNVFITRFWIKGGDKFRDYTFNLTEMFPDDVNIEAFSFEFMLDSGRAEIDSIKFVDPDGLAMIGFVWKEFWKSDIMDTTMINYIPFPGIGGYSLILPSYILIITLALVIIVYLIRKKGAVTKRSVVAGIAISFLIAGSIFALRMDYTWLLLWQKDMKILGPIDVDKRLPRLYIQELDDFLEFADFIKEVIPENEKIRPASAVEDSLTWLMRYRLLPVKSSNSANYLWSYNDKNLRYDKANKLLVVDGLEIKPVELISAYRKYGSIYRIVK